MSQILLQEAIAIGEQLSPTEKVQLIESVSTQLRRELDALKQIKEATGTNGSTNKRNNGHNITNSADAKAVEEEISPAWTLDEVRAMIQPDPKSGAEIAALLESGEIDTSVGAELEIDDVVVWLENLRRQERTERGLDA